MAVVLSTYTDNIFNVQPGANGHHYVSLFVEISGMDIDSRAFVSLDGGAYEESLNLVFDYKLPHTNNCGSPGAGYVVAVEERAIDGITVLGSDTAPAVPLCPTTPLNSTLNPIIQSCSLTAGSNTAISVLSDPAVADVNINVYLDGDTSYSIVSSATTDNTGQASVVIPTTVNGEKYWVTAQELGKDESLPNSVVIGGSCGNFKSNPSIVSGVGGATITFTPTGGSGSYSSSTTNNDTSGYTALAPIFLANGEHILFVRDNADYNKKEIIVVLIEAPYIYDAHKFDSNCVGNLIEAISYPTNSYLSGEIVKASNQECYEIIGLSASNTAVASIIGDYITCEECKLSQVPTTPTPSASSTPSSTPSGTPSSTTSSSSSPQVSSARLRSTNEDEVVNQTPISLTNYADSCSNNTKYSKGLSVHSMSNRMSVVFPYYKFKKRIAGKLLSGTYELYIQYESKNGHKSTFHKYKNRIFVSAMPLDGTLKDKLGVDVHNAYKSNHHNRQMGASGEQTLEGIQFEINKIDTRWDYINFIYAYFQSDVEPTDVREFSHSIISGENMLIDLTENIGEIVNKEKLSQRFQNILSSKTTAEKISRKFDFGIEYMPEITFDTSNVSISVNKKLIEADTTTEPTYTALYNPVTRRDDNSPLTNTAVKNSQIIVSRRTGENEVLDVIDDFENYKGQQVESSLIGHWRGETYPYAIVGVDNKGNNLFAQPIKDFTFPEQYSGDGQEYSLTKLDSGIWKLNILGAIINGIKLDPDKIYKKKYNPLTNRYERTSELLLSGFKIVRGDRFKTIEHQGVVFNTVEVDNYSSNDKKDTRVYPLPTGENTFAKGYSSNNPYQYGDGHRWVPTHQATTIADQVAAGNGNSENANSCPYWVTYHSPDVYIEGKTKVLSGEIDKLQHVGMVHKGYANNHIQLFGNRDHYYTKNYNTLNIHDDQLVSEGRPKLGDSTRIEQMFEVEKSFDSVYDEFDLANPFKKFLMGEGTYFDSNCYFTANCNKNTVMMKLKDIDAVDITRNAVNDYVSARLMNYKIQSESINKENIQYYCIGHYQQITQAILDSCEKELNVDGSVSRYVFNNIEVWGGDCYVNFFDFSRLYPLYSKGCAKSCNNQYPDYAISHILPIESKYNLALRFGRGFAKSATQSQNSSCEIVPAEQHFADGIMNQQPEEWGYNKVLNVKERISFYQQKPSDLIIINNDDAGIVWTPTKLFGAKEDQFRNNLLLDYVSLSGTNGPVTKVVKAHGSLYVVQQRGFGVLPVNQQVLMPSSEGDIVIRSGSVVGQIQQISNIYGSSHPESVWVNNNYIGFVDARMGKQMFFSQAGLARMSENNSLDDYVSAITLYNDKSEELKPMLDKAQNIVAVFDYEHGEVLTSIISFNGQTMCIGYSIDDSCYTQFFDFAPNQLFNIGRFLFSNMANRVLLHNYGKYGEFDGTYYNSIVKFIVNPNPTISSVFDNAKINVNKAGANRISNIYLKTQNETHNLVIHNAGILVDDRVEYFENDLSIVLHEEDPQGLKSRLRDHLLEVTIEIKNEDQAIDNQDKRVVISNFDTRYRTSLSNQYVE